MALVRALAAVLPLYLAMLGPMSPGARAGDCKGQRQVLREAPGFVTDGAGNYSVNGNCEWLIEGEWGSAGHTPSHLLIHSFANSFIHSPHSESPFLCQALGSEKQPTCPLPCKALNLVGELYPDSDGQLQARVSIWVGILGNC